MKKLMALALVAVMALSLGGADTGNTGKSLTSYAQNRYDYDNDYYGDIDYDYDDFDDEEQDSNWENRASVYSEGSSKGEVAIGDLYGIMGDISMEKLRKKSTPNVVYPIQTLSSKGVKRIEIRGSILGLVIVPIEGDVITLDYVGTDGNPRIDVQCSVVNDTLKVNMEGDKKKLYYMSTIDGSLVNVLRIGMPSNVLEELDIDVSTGLVNTLPGSTSTVVNTLNGMININGDIISGSVNGTCTNGNISVNGQQVNGPVTLTAKNGSVSLKCQTQSGKAVLSASNGTVNGDVETIIGQVKATVSNGSLNFHLRKEPTNLDYKLSSGTRKPVGVSKGWEKSRRFGKGGPILELGYVNGSLVFTCGDK